MKYLLVISFLFPLTVIAQTTDLSLNGGASLVTPRYGNNSTPEGNIQPAINIEAVRHAKGLLYYGVQGGYSVLAGKSILNYTDSAANVIATPTVINYYGRHSINLSLIGGVSFGKGKSLVSIGGNIGGVYSFSGYDLPTKIKKGDKELYYATSSIGTLFGFKAGYSLQVAPRIMVGISAEPQRVTIRYKNNSNNFNFHRVIGTLGVHYTF